MILSLILSRGKRLAFPIPFSTGSTTSRGVFLVLPSLFVCLLMGLATGLIAKRVSITLENRSLGKAHKKRLWIYLCSTVYSAVVADLLLEWCLIGYSYVASRLLGHDLLSSSITGICVRLLTLTVGVRIGERFTPVALTGSIATGKSSVANILLQGDPLQIIDTDAIAHEILLPPREIARSGVWCGPGDSVFEQIVKKFGDSSVDNKNILNDDGMIERRKLGDMVFKDKKHRRVLNGITHPKIIWVLLKKLVIGLYSGPRRLTVADVPLLYESKSLVWLFALTIVVACSPENQLERLRTRNPDLSVEQCQERIASQIPVDKKVAMADVVIHNNGNHQELEKEVQTARRRVSVLLHGQSALPMSGTVALIGILWVVTSVQS